MNERMPHELNYDLTEEELQREAEDALNELMIKDYYKYIIVNKSDMLIFGSEINIKIGEGAEIIDKKSIVPGSDEEKIIIELFKKSILMGNKY